MFLSKFARRVAIINRREEFRASKIRGFEHSGRLKNLIYIDELFRRCRSEGWSPLLISTSSSYHRVFRGIGCYPVNFPLWECLLVLRPYEAGWNTPNLRPWQRAALCGAGIAQSTAWAAGSIFSKQREDIRLLPAAERPMLHREQSLSFFQDEHSLAWRYGTGQYERLMAEGSAGTDLIVKQGSAGRYLRVCQWRSCSLSLEPAVISRLVQMARQRKALGVRWAVYGGNAESAGIVKRLRNLGFLCARRVRTLLINTLDQKFLEPNAWNLNDAMFSFDL